MHKTIALAAAFPLLMLAESMPLIKSVTVRGSAANVRLVTQVGRPFDAAVIGEDVHRLWRTGRFADIRVEAQPDADVARIVFQLSLRCTRELHKILIVPAVPDLHVKVPEGSDVDAFRAYTIAREAERRLHAVGFDGARVTSEIKPLTGNRADLVLYVKAGERTRTDIRFAGDPVLPAVALRGVMKQIRAQRTLPSESGLARLRSLYLAQGYFDAKLHVDAVETGKRTRITIQVRSGPRYTPSPASAGICPSLLAQRRAAERGGILDFAAALHVPDLSVTVDRGRPYRIGRIEFTGLHHYRDVVVRRSLLVDEGEPLDEELLRKSLARLNRAAMFEPLGIEDASVNTNETTGVADITIHLAERKRGAWNVSGPIGPPSLLGPLQASIGVRLPAWTSYLVSVSLIPFVHPLAPVLALTRPFTPGEGWKSGWMIAPQLGWRTSGLAYGATQISQRLLPLLAGDSGLAPDLPVAVEGVGTEGVMICEAPKPRMRALRTAASFSLRLLGR
jgi:outer membrane protein assembly factor BamA